MPTDYMNQLECPVGSKSFRQTETDGSVSARVQHPMNQVDLKRLLLRDLTTVPFTYVIFTFRV